jgi:hypothetical protein
MNPRWYGILFDPERLCFSLAYQDSIVAGDAYVEPVVEFLLRENAKSEW